MALTNLVTVIEVDEVSLVVTNLGNFQAFSENFDKKL
jgi:hypothetical protein